MKIDATLGYFKMPDRLLFLDAEFIPPNKCHMMFVEKWHLILYQGRDRTVYVDYVWIANRIMDVVG